MLLVLIVPAVAPAWPGQAVVDFGGRWFWKGTAGWQRIRLDLVQQGSSVHGVLTMGDGFLEGGEDAIPDMGRRAIRMGPSTDRLVPFESVSIDELWRYGVPSVSFGIANGRIEDGVLEFEHEVYAFEASQNLETSTYCCFWPAGTLRYRATITGEELRLVREVVEDTNAIPFSGRQRREITAVRDGAPERARANESAPTFVADTGRVRAIVLDTENRAVTSLSVEDIAVEVAGERRMIYSIHPPAESRNFMVLADRGLTWLIGGGSRDLPSEIVADWARYQRDMYEGMGDALLSSFTRLRGGDRVGVWAFEDRIESVLDWTVVDELDWSDADFTPLLINAGGYKDLYGALTWAIGSAGRFREPASIVVFTDGRDGRLGARWFRDEVGRGVLDPLFGLEDGVERETFEQLLGLVDSEAVSIDFVVVHGHERPTFLFEHVLPRPGPVLLGQLAIPDLYPGASIAEEEFLGRVDERLGALARLSGGSVWSLGSPEDGLALLQRIPELLGVGAAVTIEYEAAGEPGSPVVSVEDPTFRAVTLTSGAGR